MHGFLLIGNNPESKKEKLLELSKSLDAKVISHQLSKVEDVKNLIDFIRLSLNEKTIIYIENIEEATHESLNSFLKTLEEPQENLYFVLTASSLQKVLPTISSRCQIINLGVRSDENKDLGETIKFNEMSIGEKLSFIEKLRDRPSAILFLEDLIYYYHSLIHSNELDYKRTLKNTEISLEVLKNLKSNGNINLQLTYLVSNLV